MLKITKHDFCRICSKLKPMNILESIFYVNQEFISPVCEFIFQKLNIAENDDLPQQICKKCIQFLINVRKFWYDCENSQVVLEKCIKKTLVLKNKKLQMSTNDNEPRLFETNELSSQQIQLKSFEDDYDIIEDSNDDDKFTNDNDDNKDTNNNNSPIEFINIDSCIKNNDSYNNIKIENDNDNNINNNNKIINEYNVTNLEFQCKVCNVFFNEEIILIKHIIWKHKEINETNQCLCGRPFKSKQELEKHIIKCSKLSHPDDENPYYCEKCSLTFTSRIQKVKHCKIEHPNPIKHKCDTCLLDFFTVYQFDKHMEAIHSVKYDCKVCGKLFRRKHYLKGHIKKIHAIHHNVCSYCNLKFTTLAKYNYHMRTHLPNKQFNCQYCDKKFLQSTHKIEHERLHTGERPYLCTICGKDFRLNEFLKVHMYTHTGSSPHICERCGKRFSSAAQLREHMQKYTSNMKEENEYECNLCDNVYSKKISLKYHKYEIHNGPIPKPRLRQRSIANNKMPLQKSTINAFACNVCGKEYQLPSLLRAHMKLHSEIDRPFLCDKCNCRYKRAAHLRTHIDAVHLKIKPYKCKECKSCFSQSGALKDHMLIHGGINPYNCDICNKNFRYRYRFKIHMRHHNNEPHKCEYCDVTYFFKQSLNAHMVRVHMKKESAESCMAK